MEDTLFFEIQARLTEAFRNTLDPRLVSIPSRGPTIGRAVLLHKTAPLLLKRVRRFDRHSNSLELLNLVGALTSRGFEVLIVDRSLEHERIPLESFDLVVGLADGNSGRHLSELYERSPAAVKIAYCTGAEPSWGNEAICARYENAFNRKGRFPPETKFRVADLIDFDQVARHSDALIVVGNDTTGNTYRDRWSEIPIFLVRGIAISPSRKLSTSNPRPRAFLCMAGDGAILKGVDLLFECAVELPQVKFGHCGKLDHDFLDLHDGRIPSPGNMELHGFTFARSLKFRKLVQDYAFGVLPSSKEGMATSVLTMMSFGLIPVVTKETGVDVEPFGFVVPVNQSLGRVINQIVKISDRELFDRQRATLAASEKYLPSGHQSDLARALDSILGDD